MKNYLIVLDTPDGQLKIVTQGKNRELPHVVLGRFIKQTVSGESDVKLENGTKMSQYLIPLLKNHKIPVDVIPLPQNCTICKTHLEPPVWGSKCEDCQ